MLSNSRGWQDWVDEQSLQSKELADDKLSELDFLASTHIQFFQDYVDKVKEDFEPVRVFSLENGIEHTTASEPTLLRQSVFSPIREGDTFSTDGPSFASSPMTLNGSDPIQEMAAVKETDLLADISTPKQDELDLQLEAPETEEQHPVAHAVASLIKQTHDNGVLEKESLFASLPQRAPLPVKRASIPPPTYLFQAGQKSPEKEQVPDENEKKCLDATAENQVEVQNDADHQYLEEPKRSFSTNRQRIHEAINSLRASKAHTSAKEEDVEPPNQEKPNERTQDEDEWVPRLGMRKADPSPEPTPRQPKGQSTPFVQTPSAFDRAKAMLFGPPSAPVNNEMHGESIERIIKQKTEPQQMVPMPYMNMKQSVQMEEELKERLPKTPAKAIHIAQPTQVQQLSTETRYPSPQTNEESPPQVPPKPLPSYDRDITRQNLRQTKDFGFKVKQAPVAIRFATASQRELVDQRKTGVNPPPVVPRPSKEVAREPSLSASRGSVSSAVNVPQKPLASRPIKALAAANQARRKEEQERERKLMAKHELERRREETKEERMKEVPAAGSSRLAATKKLAKNFIQKTTVGHEKRDVLGDVGGNALRQEEKKRPVMKVPGPPEKRQKVSDHEEVKSIPHVDIVKFSTETIKFDKERQARPEVELPEIDSDYSDDESRGEVQARKDANPLPNWAESPALREMLRTQEHLDPDQVFGAVVQPNLEVLFSKASSSHRWRPRSSSANWDSGDRLTDAERHRYNLLMGYK